MLRDFFLGTKNAFDNEGVFAFENKWCSRGNILAPLGICRLNFAPPQSERSALARKAVESHIPHFVRQGFSSPLIRSGVKQQKLPEFLKAF